MALRHSDHCFFQSVRGAQGSHRYPRWICLGAFASHRQSPVASTRTCPALSWPGLGLRDDRGRKSSRSARSARQNSGALRRILTISLLDWFYLIYFPIGLVLSDYFPIGFPRNVF